ncbi:MAG: hypothetical protein GWP04_10245 [Gammaproteobacteria bacterium]|nr:hypothetical protein [Gammaproteobacteria bacterium]
MDIEATLDRCERALAEGHPVDLSALGFWRAVAAVKWDADLVTPYADRIAAIDETAFLRWALLTVPTWVGTVIMSIATLVGLGVVLAAYFVPSPWNGIAVVVGTGILVVSTHGLGHLAVGRLLGIRFTHWFIAMASKPQPGVKIDYTTYLRTPPKARAWMHASGALVTKAIPFLSLGVAWGSHSPAWTWWILLLLGLFQIATDALFSVNSSDWKKFRREMRYARS